MIQQRHSSRAAGLTAAALAMTTGLAVLTTAGAADAAPSGQAGLRLAAEQPRMDGAAIAAADSAAKAAAGPDGRVRVVVKLTDASLAAYRGGVAGLTATAPDVTGAAKLSPSGASSARYLSYLHARMDAFQARALRASPSARVTQRLDTVVGGVALTLPAADVAKLAKDPQVAAILPDTLNKPLTDASPAFIGAPSAWRALGGQKSAGERVIVGVLDSGIWPEHPSLSDPDPAGRAYPAPRPPLSGTRQCDFTGGTNPGPSYTCNNKLIGAFTFMNTYNAVIGLEPSEYTSARDDDGHGTHTATTAAGNGKVPATIGGVSRGLVSGIAPRAQVIAYKVCGAQGCFSSDSAAAVQRAILDDVDVINFSISGGSNPYADVVSLAFLDAYNAGVFVSASAGNSGPSANTTDHREPWVATVAASTSNRSFVGTATLSSSDGSSLTLNGVTVAPPLATASPVVDAAAAGDPLCLNGTADAAFAGKVVLCKRGTNGRVAKGYNVSRRGAVGMLLYNQSTAVTDLETDNHFLPALHMQVGAGQSAIAFLGAHPDVAATITSGVATATQGDVMASFSSRGGNAQTLGISKPDVTAPGVQILAGNTPTPSDPAVVPGELFQAIAGTSMSSPHVAGAGALLVALHPTWTPGQIKSALMTTAQTQVVKEDGVTPTDAFDDGSGRIDLSKARDPWFTFNESGANYVANRNALFKANYPSLYVPNLAGSLTVTRTLTSVARYRQYYTAKVSAPSDLKVTVSPKTFSLAPAAQRTLVITVDGRDVPIGQTRFATITLRSDGRSFTFPVTVVRGQGPVTVDKTCAPETIPVGSTVDCTVTMTNNSAVPSTVQLSDTLPRQLRLVEGSVTGGVGSGNAVTALRTIPGRQAPAVNVAYVDPATTPAGYLPLSLFGITPVSGVGDETISNFTVPAFTVAGVTYTRIGLVSNGYVVLGGGSGADVQFANTAIPNGNPPNNYIAPFWTDLNPTSGGALRVGILTDGVNQWVVADYEGVSEFSVPSKKHSFQVWIGINGVEDVSVSWGPSNGNGDGGLATVGVENPDGTQGQALYVNGVGTLPADGDSARVTGTPGTTSSATVTYQARGRTEGAYVNYAEVRGDTFDGVAIGRFAGTVTP